MGGFAVQLAIYREKISLQTDFPEQIHVLNRDRAEIHDLSEIHDLFFR